jgi:hypothetical protein
MILFHRPTTGSCIEVSFSFHKVGNKTFIQFYNNNISAVSGTFFLWRINGFNLLLLVIIPSVNKNPTASSSSFPGSHGNRYIFRFFLSAE